MGDVLVVDGQANPRSLAISLSLSLALSLTHTLVGNSHGNINIKATGSTTSHLVRSRANMAHTRQSRPDSGLGCQVTLYVAPSSLESAPPLAASRSMWVHQFDEPGLDPKMTDLYWKPRTSTLE